MSNASPYNTDSTSSERSSTTAVPRIDPQYPVRFVGFWTAVITPFVLLTLIITGAAMQSPELLGSLLVANFTGLVLGKDHNR